MMMDSLIIDSSEGTGVDWRCFQSVHIPTWKAGGKWHQNVAITICYSDGVHFSSYFTSCL